MKKYTVEQGIVAPLDRTNVDTDLIIQKLFWNDQVCIDIGTV